MERAGDDLVEILDDPDARPRDRAGAAAALVELCRRDAEARGRFLMRFVTLLSDESPAVRGEAALGTVVCDEELRQVDRVARLLDDPRPGVRLQAVHVLAPLGLASLHDPFARRLDDPDRLVRVAAAAALSAAGDARAARTLVEAIGHRATRFDALLALARAPVPDAEAPARRVLGRLLCSRFEWAAAAGVLAALGREEGRAHLLAQAVRGRAVRPLAIELLGELAVEGSAPLLARLAADRADAHRGAALRALAALGTAEAAQACARTLLDEQEDPDVRCDAAEGLLLARRPEGREALAKASAGAGDEQVRRVATTALTLFGRPVAEIRLYLPISGEELVGP